MAKIKQSVKKTGKARKEVIVAELVEKIDGSNGLVFVDYKGLTHQQLENLKKDLKTGGSTIVIAKNSLIKLSLGKSKNFADFKDNEGLDLPTATLFIQGDMVEPLKKLQKVVKELGLPKIKFAILEGSLADEAGVLKIAALPGRVALITQFVGMLNSPIQGFVTGLNAIPQKFVMTLGAIAKAKPTTPAPAAATPSENQTVVEVAAPANEPATQPDAPVVTDESADAGTDDAPSEEKPTEEPNEAKKQPEISN